MYSNVFLKTKVNEITPGGYVLGIIYYTLGRTASSLAVVRALL